MTISRMALMGRPCMPCSCKQRARQHEVTHTQSLKQQPSMWIVGHRHPGTASAPAAAACLWCTSAAQQSSKTERPTVGSNSTRPGLEPEPRRSCMAVRSLQCARRNAIRARLLRPMRSRRPLLVLQARLHRRQASLRQGATPVAASRRPRRPITPPFTPRGVTWPPRSGGLW